MTVVGHRGAAGLEAENTVPSFLAALNLGCRALELDVHCLPREVNASTPALAVIHDASVDRTTNLSGPVSDYTREELAQAIPPVPTLDQVIEAILAWCNHTDIPARNITLNIELKGAGTAAPVKATITRHSALTYLVSSFDHAELDDFRRLDSDTAVAPLFDRWRKDCVDVAISLDATGINLSKRIVTQKRLQMISAAGFDVWVYTVNSRRSAERLERLGVAGIFTDRPDRMLT